MDRIKYLLLLAFCCTLGIPAFAQKSARISGTISSDAEGPLFMVNVTERDKNNRIIEATVTDFEGNFSMVVKNTANELEISYIGYKTQKIKIGTRTVFNIKMVEDKILDEVIIEAQEVVRTGGLDILEREMTHATQKISMEEMQGLSFASVDEALQGQIAGLDVVMGSGSVGKGTQMRLRGVSMLEGTDSELQPLLVVDDNIFQVDEGFDFANSTEDKFAELLMINTEDIAEIEVLKDAASCAVWGSAGANGVIKIKTKRGKRGPTRVNFTYKFKDKWTPEGLNLLNGDDYTMMMKQALFNRNNQPVNIPELNYNPDHPEYENFNNNTDWVDAIEKHGYRHEYSLNLNGGGEKATFRVSGSYTNETGQVIGEEMNQLSSRLALDYYVSQRIKVIADFSFSYVTREYHGSGLLYTAQKMMPNMSIYKQDDYGNNTSEYYNMLETATDELKNNMTLKNPVADGNLDEVEHENYSINPQITLEYNLLGLEDNQSQLKYRGMVNLNASTSADRSYKPGSLNPRQDWSNSIINQSYSSDSKGLGFSTRHNLIFTPYLGSRDHYLTMTGQFELRTHTGNGQSSTSQGLPTGNITNSTVGAKLANASSYKSESRNISFVYDAHYSYKSKYMLRFSIRGEGLTAMGDDKKWVIFPAVSGRWNISDEPWMQWAKPVVSMLSIRPGFGMDGHAPGSNRTFNTYSSTGKKYNGYGGYQMDNIRLTALSTSDKREWNIGSDFGFFDGKITGSFNYYIATTYDQLVSNYRIPSSTGYSSLAYKNSGTMRNSGWELNLNTASFELFKDFSVSMYFNIGNNYNEILEMEEAYLDARNDSYDYPRNSAYLGRVQVGNPYGAIYGFRYKGVYRFSYKNWEKALSEAAAGRNGTCPIVYDSNGQVVFNADGTPKQMTLFYERETKQSTYQFRGGDAIYEDVNKDGTINQLDIVYLGNSNPEAQGGFGFTFRYKKWTLKTNFTYRYGVDVVNSNRMNFENMSTFNNQSVAVNWRWRKEGDITEIPRAVYGASSAYNYLGSDRYVEDASYLRLSYVQLSYNFNTDWVKKIGLRSLSVYASADNLIHWSKYTGLDPEINSGGDGIAYDNSETPRPRSYTISVSMGF